MAHHMGRIKETDKNADKSGVCSLCNYIHTNEHATWTLFIRDGEDMLSYGKNTSQ